MRKRTYGTGSFRQLGTGKYELRYRGKSKTVEATNDKLAQRALDRWVDERDEESDAGPIVTMNALLDAYLADQRKHKREQTAIVEKKIAKHLRPRIGKLDAKKFGRDAT